MLKIIQCLIPGHEAPNIFQAGIAGTTQIRQCVEEGVAGPGQISQHAGARKSFRIYPDASKLLFLNQVDRPSHMGKKFPAQQFLNRELELLDSTGACSPRLKMCASRCWNA